MATFSLLVLLILASFTSAWGTETRDSGQNTCTKNIAKENIMETLKKQHQLKTQDSAQNTCTKNIATEEIMKKRKKEYQLKTQGRAPVCTNAYSFTFVKPGTSMSFNSPVKQWETPKSINCGLWFWTDDGFTFDVKCSMIDINKEDRMVLYDGDNDQMTRISVDSNKYDFSFVSKNVAIGLEMKTIRRKPSYSCKIRSFEAPKYRTYIVGGDVRNVDVISDGKVTALPNLLKKVYGNSAVLHGGKLYSCGGKYNEKECYSLDLSPKPLAWKQTIISLPVPAYFSIMMAVGDNLWLLVSKKLYAISFKSGSTISHNLPSGLSVGESSCGGGNEFHRYVLPANTPDVWINTSPNNPEQWTKEAILGDALSQRACMIKGMDIYVTGGKKKYTRINISEKVSLKDYSIQRFSKMLVSRRVHAIGIINDEIAVFCGWGSRLYDTVEVYKATEDKWKNSALRLSAGSLSSMGYVTIKS